VARPARPVPGERNREWLFRGRSEFTVAVNPMPDAVIIPGRNSALPWANSYDERYRIKEKMLGMERTLAKKWE
jgi:hypothetical protein